MKKLTIGEKIRELRKARRLSQIDLAMKSLVSPITIVRIENGQVNPIPATLKCIADALEIKVEDLK